MQARMGYQCAIGEYGRHGFGPICQGLKGVHGRFRIGARSRADKILPRHLDSDLAHTPQFPRQSGGA